VALFLEGLNARLLVSEGLVDLGGLLLQLAVVRLQVVKVPPGLLVSLGELHVFLPRAQQFGLDGLLVGLQRVEFPFKAPDRTLQLPELLRGFMEVFLGFPDPLREGGVLGERLRELKLVA